MITNKTPPPIPIDDSNDDIFETASFRTCSSITSSATQIFELSSGGGR